MGWLPHTPRHKKSKNFFRKIKISLYFLTFWCYAVGNSSLINNLSKMALANNPYKDLPIAEMIYFDYSNLQEIEELAAGLDAEEVCAWYGLTPAEIQQSEKDWLYFQRAFNKGRANAKRKAVGKLFEAMGGRQAKESAISYLARFSDGWREPVASDNQTSGKFSFQVKIDD